MYVYLRYTHVHIYMYVRVHIHAYACTHTVCGLQLRLNSRYQYKLLDCTMCKEAWSVTRFYNSSLAPHLQVLLLVIQETSY